MWLPKTDATSKGKKSGSVAVAIDNDKTSKIALKWTLENLTSRGQTLALIHVAPKSQSSSGSLRNAFNPSFFCSMILMSEFSFFFYLQT